MAVQQSLLRVLLQITGIVSQSHQLPQPLPQFLVGECSGLRQRFKPSQIAVLVLPCPAGGVRLAEAALLFARSKVTLALPCQHGRWPQGLFSPVQQIRKRHFKGFRLFLDPGLHNAHAHGLDLVRCGKQSIRAQRVVHQLGVILAADRDALPVLEIHDMQHAVPDQQAVASAKTSGHPLLHIDLLLNKHAGAGGKAKPQAMEKIYIEICSAYHFSRIIGLTVQTNRFTENRSCPPGFPVLQTMPQMGFAHLMRPAAFLGILAGSTFHVLRQTGRGRAGDPPGSAGRAQQRVFNRRHRAPP